MAVMRWLGHTQSALVKQYCHLHDVEAQRQMRAMAFIENFGGTGSPEG